MKWRIASLLGIGSAVLLAIRASAAPVEIEGAYSSTDGSSVRLVKLASGIYRASSETWEGVGMFDGTSYWGVFRTSPAESTKAAGTHKGKLMPDGTLSVHVELVGGGKPFDTVWSRIRIEVLSTPSPTAPGDGLPKPGDYVYVEELPEAITKVPPEYPDIGRSVEGTVLVQALVGRDGRVKDTRIVKSIPLLDDAAVKAVRQWVFKPAMAKGSPIAVWVAVPVKFTLK